MFKKLINYYWAVIKKYGIILPIAIAVAGFGAMIALDLTNAFSSLVNKSVVWFVVIAVLAVGAFAYGAIYTFKNLEAKELGIQDLGLTCIAAVGILSIIMFIFTSSWNAMSITKWLLIAAGTALCVVLAIFRMKNAD